MAAVGSRLVRDRILVIGAAGMIGRKLTRACARTARASSSCTTWCRSKAASAVSDLSTPGEAEKLVASRPDLIFHLAAIVSGEAEADFEKGYRINLDGTRRLFEAIRKVAMATGRGWCSPPRSRCSARPFPRRSATSS